MAKEKNSKSHLQQQQHQHHQQQLQHLPLQSQERIRKEMVRILIS